MAFKGHKPHKLPSDQAEEHNAALSYVDSLNKYQRDLLPLAAEAPTLVPVTGFQNGWRAYVGGTQPAYAPYYWIDSAGVVWFRGLVDKNGGNFVAMEAMFAVSLVALDTGILTAESDGGGVSGNAQVRIVPGASSTTVYLGERGGPANPVGWLSLDNLHFRTR